MASVSSAWGDMGEIWGRYRGAIEGYGGSATARPRPRAHLVEDVHEEVGRVVQLAAREARRLEEGDGLLAEHDRALVGVRVRLGLELGLGLGLGLGLRLRSGLGLGG